MGIRKILKCGIDFTLAGEQWSFTSICISVTMPSIIHFVALINCTPFFFCRSAIYASRLYLNQYHKTHPERLTINKYEGPKICGECMPLIFLNLMHLSSILILEMT